MRIFQGSLYVRKWAWSIMLSLIAGLVILLLVQSTWLVQSLYFPKTPIPRTVAVTRRPEVRQVIFAKVHKAASSTVQNILFRFAMERGLDVLLPHENNPSEHINENHKTIDPRRLIPQPRGKPFDILCNHLIFDEREIAPYFPNGTVHLAILREPLAQSLSALAYYTNVWPRDFILKGVRKYADPVRGYLTHPQDFVDASGREVPFVDNRMSLDLGFPLARLSESRVNTGLVKEFIASVDKTFELVLIAEHFDESLVLMKRQFGWSMRDILYSRINEAQNRVAKNSTPDLRAKFSQQDIQSFEHWAALDIALYRHFLAKLLARMKHEPSFDDEVRTFRGILQDVNAFCDEVMGQVVISKLLESSSQLNIKSSGWNEEFSVSHSDCRVFRMTETEARKMVYAKQIERYREKPLG